MKRTRYSQIDPVTNENLADEWEFQKPGICNWATAATMAVSAYQANRQKKAQQKAAAQQQEGVQQAQQYSQEAADKASGMLQPLAQLRTGALPQIQQMSDRYKQLGGIGQQRLLDQTKPLDVNQFYNPMQKMQLDAGRQAVESSAAARGGLLSGAALQSLQKMGQGIAANNWANAAQLAQADRSQQINVGNNLAGFGDTALNTQNSLFNTGVNALGQQANLVSGQGTNNANLAMTAGNVAARSTASQPDVAGSALQAGLGQMGANNGAGWTALGKWIDSDERKKYDVDSVTDEEIEEFLENMQPKSFNYKEGAKQGGAPEGRQTGIMAQDAEKSKVGKRLVSDDGSGKKLNIPMTVSTLLATASSLNRRIERLEEGKE